MSVLVLLSTGSLAKQSRLLDGRLKEKMSRAVKVLTQSNQGGDQII